MEIQTIAMQRLNDWLKTNELPKLAKECIENFVLSCEAVNDGDITNFISIDIANFSIPVQERLVTGFFIAYTGQREVSYHYGNGGFYQVSRN